VIRVVQLDMDDLSTISATSILEEIFLHDYGYSSICEPSQCTLSDFAFDSTEKRDTYFWIRVIPSASSDGRGSEAKARRIFLFSCANQRCDERAISYTPNITTHRAQW
jgi:hypothetical protein